jgi:DNA-binding response OmpR family regulator
MPPRVLIIEDEPEIAYFLLRGLREEGYAAEHAADGETGWQALQAGPWDVVILDWWLPKMDGLTLLRRCHKPFASGSLATSTIS